MPDNGVRLLSTVDATYIAGLIDAEGTITLTREHANENRRLVVSISNTELEILRFVNESVGVGKITSKRTYSDKHTPSYAYKITNQQALALLTQISEYLRSYKRGRAELVLREYVKLIPRNGKYKPDQKLAREDFELRFLQIRP